MGNKQNQNDADAKAKADAEELAALEKQEAEEKAKADAKAKADEPVNVTNNHDATLHLCTGDSVAPGKTVQVVNSNKLLGNSVTAAWLDAGVISIDES